MDETDNLYVRTIYDGKDLRQVDELYYYDESGEEVIHEYATNVCMGIDTCADMGDDLEPTLRGIIEPRLRAAGIRFKNLIFEDWH